MRDHSDIRILYPLGNGWLLALGLFENLYFISRIKSCIIFRITLHVLQAMPIDFQYAVRLAPSLHLKGV
jgi:hypothetical protein